MTAAHVLDGEPGVITLGNERIDSPARVAGLVERDEGDIAILVAAAPAPALTALPLGGRGARGRDRRGRRLPAG